MGGFGSGFRLAKKDTVECAYMRISVNDFKVGSNDQKIRSATISHRKNKYFPYETYNVEFLYKTNQNPISQKDENNIVQDNSCSIIITKDNIQQIIKIVTSKIHFGGFRYWFECPKCRHKARYLYITKPNDTFACRECKQLTYLSVQKHDNSKKLENVERFLLSLSAQLEKSREKYTKMRNKLSHIKK